MHEINQFITLNRQAFLMYFLALVFLLSLILPPFIRWVHEE